MPLFRRISLGGVCSRNTLLSACRRLAEELAGELAERGLLYREVALEALTEAGRAGEEMRLARPATYRNLPLHAGRLLAKLELTAPVEGVLLTVNGLLPAAGEQTTIFQLDRRNRRARLERALAAISGKYRITAASAWEADRREKMLAFYDPWRWGPGAPESAEKQAADGARRPGPRPGDSPPVRES